jgi:hypothetical protein
VRTDFPFHLSADWLRGTLCRGISAPPGRAAHRLRDANKKKRGRLIGRVSIVQL